MFVSVDIGAGVMPATMRGVSLDVMLQAIFAPARVARSVDKFSISRLQGALIRADALRRVKIPMQLWC